MSGGNNGRGSGQRHDTHRISITSTVPSPLRSKKPYIFLAVTPASAALTTTARARSRASSAVFTSAPESETSYWSRPPNWGGGGG